MGVQCRIEVIAPDAPLLLDRCHEMVGDLEGLWSRFLPGSDVSRMNNAGGSATHVDERTVALLAAMKAAFVATRGSFNPTRLPEQVASGDSRSLVSHHVTRLPHGAHAWTSLDLLDIRPDGTVTMPPTMTIDAGGIAKGHAADLVAEFAVANGAAAVCVNLGGDIRVANATQHTHDFAIDVMSPLDASQVVDTVSLRNGAVATSAVNARRRAARGVDNHIQGARSGLVGATVIASTAMWAEVWAKHALVSPEGCDDIHDIGLAALTIDDAGSTAVTPNWNGFTQC